MTPPRFYAPEVELVHDFWLHDEQLVRRWQKLGYQAGQQLVLFDGRAHDRLYRLEELTPREAHMALITDFERQLPDADTYLLWHYSHASADETLKTYTTKGITHFLPLISGQAAADFDESHVKKILIEASEKSGRSDIPIVRQPMHLETALQQLSGKVKLFTSSGSVSTTAKESEPLGYLITPEGGWEKAEQELLYKYGVQSPHTS